MSALTSNAMIQSHSKEEDPLGSGYWHLWTDDLRGQPSGSLRTGPI